MVRKAGVQGVSPCSRKNSGNRYGCSIMSLKFFVVPVQDSIASEDELNGFLASHKILSIDRQLVDQGVNSFWAICIDYLTGKRVETGQNPNLSRNRVDYKSILRAEEFEVFSRLRQLRKEMAQVEAVPVYALFTNEQLAQMVQRRRTLGPSEHWGHPKLNHKIKPANRAAQ